MSGWPQCQGYEEQGGGENTVNLGFLDMMLGGGAGMSHGSETSQPLSLVVLCVLSMTEAATLGVAVLQLRSPRENTRSRPPTA